MIEKKPIPYPNLSEKISSAKTLTELSAILHDIANSADNAAKKPTTVCISAIRSGKSTIDMYAEMQFWIKAHKALKHFEEHEHCYLSYPRRLEIELDRR
jgi:hypothetical protein